MIKKTTFITAFALLVCLNVDASEGAPLLEQARRRASNEVENRCCDATSLLIPACSTIACTGLLIATTAAGYTFGGSKELALCFEIPAVVGCAGSCLWNCCKYTCQPMREQLESERQTGDNNV